MGCCPEYYPACSYNTSDRSCSVPDTDGGSPEAGATEAGSDAASDAALDSPSPDTGSPDAGDAATDAASDEDGGSVSYTDILYCPCHGSVYDAKTGEAIYGPATGTGNLQIMKTCVGGGYVFVFIPDNMLGAGSDPVCGAGGEGTEP
jgi:Rieske Fe-S protein